MGDQPKRILVHAPNWIGDQVLSFPFFYALRKQFPGAVIGVVARPWVAKIQFANLVNRIFVQDGKPSVLSALKSHGPWDLGFALPSSFSSAWLLKRAGVRETVGYDGDFRSLILKRKFSRKAMFGIHRSLQYLELLKGFSSDSFDGTALLKIAVKDFNSKIFWPGTSDIPSPSGNYWVLAPGSQAESRRWPAESFRKIARAIFKKTGYLGFIVGGEAERALAHTLAADRETGLINYCAEYGLTDLAVLFKGSRFTLSNDSGLAHMASISGATTHLVWGAGDLRHTFPIGPGNTTFSQNKLDCWPCEKNICPKSAARNLACLKGLSVEAVLADLQKEKLI
jgi:heptosyltransferase-2